MRIERPSPDAYPVVYDDAGNVLEDPNKQTKAQEKAVEAARVPDPAAHPASGGGS